MKYFTRYGEFYGDIDSNEKSLTFNLVRNCIRCSGRGGNDSWKHTGWTCFRCGGSGKDPKPEIIKVYTEERLISLNKSKEKKDKKLEDKRIIESKIKKEQNRKMWIDNLEILKNIAKLDSIQKRWYINKIKQIGYISENMSNAVQKSIERQNIKINKINNSNFIGTIGEKFEKKLTIEDIKSFETIYGNMRIYIFHDENNNYFVWKTSNYIEYDEIIEDNGIYKREYIRNFGIGDTIEAKFSIKGYSTYNGLKQNIIQRLKRINKPQYILNGSPIYK